MIDIDNFKRYNDTFGHPAGDAALKKVASTLQLNCNRSTDFVACYGGEEFALVMGTTSSPGARFMAEKLRLAVQGLQQVHGRRHMTVSIGGASAIPQCNGSFVQLVECADQALYQAKRSGKNQSAIHEYRP